MKDCRNFLKLIGIFAGAVTAGVLAEVTAGTPVPAPRTIQDIESPKPYIGPDGVPGGDYIKERPKIVPEQIIIPPLTPDQRQWIVDGEKVITFDPTPPIQLKTIDWDVEWDTEAPLAPRNVIQTTPGLTFVASADVYTS